METDKPFFVKNESDFPALRAWLKGKKYNTFISGLTDKKGNQMIGLSWDFDIDNDWSRKWVGRGLLIILDN